MFLSNSLLSFGRMSEVPKPSGELMALGSEVAAEFGGRFFNARSLGEHDPPIRIAWSDTGVVKINKQPAGDLHVVAGLIVPNTGYIATLDFTPFKGPTDTRPSFRCKYFKPDGDIVKPEVNELISLEWRSAASTGPDLKVGFPFRIVSERNGRKKVVFDTKSNKVTELVIIDMLQPREDTVGVDVTSLFQRATDLPHKASDSVSQTDSDDPYV